MMHARGLALAETGSGPRDAAARLLEDAERLHRAHRLEEAIDAYQELVRLQDDACELPELALERIAGIQLGAGRTAEAAATLDRLAARAEWLGHAEAQAGALLRAARLYGGSGARAAAFDRAIRLRALRESRRLSPETRARIRALAG